MSLRAVSVAAGLLLLAACGAQRGETPPAVGTRPSAAPPAILLVTLDTTRYDALTAEVAPRFSALAASGLVFTRAYSTAPSTLTAHTSMFSGLYPAGHGVHENGRFVGAGVPLLAEELGRAGYDTAAFVSGYPLAAQFGLSRGFALYDDTFGGGLERGAAATTELALRHLAARRGAPFFLWVHYYDPHEPYAPPEPFRGRFAADPYRGEIAAMDAQLGRLLDAFSAAAGPEGRIAVLADHGEGRGDHGEAFHGNLLYQSTLHVPLALAGGGLAAGRRDDAVSTRQIRATLLGWARGRDEEGSLLSPSAGAPVLAEAMMPFLNYRWQPQVMAAAGKLKLIRAGRLELYDVEADPGERNDLAASAEIDRTLAKAIADYPLPASGSAADLSRLGEEERRKLASLGYVTSAGATDRVPEGAPRPADQTALFPELDGASHDFVAADYGRAAGRFEKILAADPGNLMAAVRLGVCLSLLGRNAGAEAAFARARRIDPESLEVRHYLAMHHLKNGQLAQAAPLFEEVLAAQPERQAALEGLAEIRERQGRTAEAAELYQRALAGAPDPAKISVKLGLLRMDQGDTDGAIAAFEAAREKQGAAFAHQLELGVLYLAAQRLEDARGALDAVPAAHPGKAMALFKRAQVSVLLGESDRAEKVRQAYAAAADPELRRLIEGEKLFAGLLPR